MLDQVNAIYQEIEQFPVSSKEELEQFRLRFIGRKGAVTELFDALKTVAPDERRAMGQQLNTLKNFAQDRFQSFTQLVETLVPAGDAAPIDLTLPGIPNQNGAVHPLSAVRQRIIQIFERIGFDVADGPEIESDWYNFGALNFPDNHPAREMQDTFFVEKQGGASAGDAPTDMLLRTHTSNVQIRSRAYISTEMWGLRI